MHLCTYISETAIGRAFWSINYFMSNHNIHAFNAINISIQCGTLKGTLLNIQEIPTTSVTCVALDWHYYI